MGTQFSDVNCVLISNFRIESCRILCGDENFFVDMRRSVICRIFSFLHSFPYDAHADIQSRVFVSENTPTKRYFYAYQFEISSHSPLSNLFK